MAKKEKNKANWEYQDGDKDKVKLHKPLSTNTSQPQTYASKKNKYYRSRQGGFSAIGVNTTEVAKKDKNKNKAKDLNHIKYYICKQKDYYANRCFKKIKM